MLVIIPGSWFDVAIVVFVNRAASVVVTCTRGL